jgi:hypothetical protein
VRQFEPGHRPPTAPPPARPRPSSAGQSSVLRGPLRSMTLTRNRPVPGPGRDRGRLPDRPSAVLHAIAGQLPVYQQDGDIPARMHGAGHPSANADDPRPRRPRRIRHALPDRRPGHQRTRPSPARLTAGSPGRRTGTRGYTPGTPGNVKPEHAASAARPWPSVKQPTVRTDRDGARIPSAIRPWTPRHSGPQRDKVTHHGTEKKRPANARIRS